MLGLPEDPRSISGRLLSLAAMCVAQEMSGRALRRLPVLAHARYISTAPSSLLQAHTVSLPAPAPRKKSGRRIRTDTTESTPTLQGPPGMDVHLWFDAMERVVGERADQRGRIESSLNVKTEPS
jgi:pachytene checkpoint protein 2